MLRKSKKSSKFRNVFYQGDYWTSNILLKIDKNKFPVDCCLVDYQLTRYSSIAQNIYYLLCMTATKEIRTKQLREYYSEFLNILQRYKVDMRSPRLCHAIIILQLMCYTRKTNRKISLKIKIWVTN